MEACVGCGRKLRADVFNAFVRQIDAAPQAETVQVQGQSQCFYHPGKKAVAPCDACGRLLCNLCQVEMDDRILCMGCLKVGRDKSKISTLQTQQVLYDSIALSLAIYPIITFVGIFFTFLTAPVALYFAIRHWRTTYAVLPKRWAKSIFAALLATGQLAGWVLILIGSLR